MAKMSIEELRELSARIDDLYGAGKGEEGRKLLTMAMEHAKESDDAYDLFFRGEWAAYEEEKFDNQLNWFKKALSARPDDAFLMRCVGVSLTLLGEADEATRWFDKALAINPKDWEAMRQRGVALSKLGKEGEAITWYDKALAENPKDWKSMQQFGVALSKLDKEDEAIAWYDKALAENPKDWNAMRQRGVSLSELGKEDEAIAWYDKALAENPKDWDAMRQRGVSLSRLGKEDEAIAWYDKALAENPKDWDAMRNRGVSLSRLDKEDEAIAWYDKALAENPKDWDAMRQRGVSLSKQGKYDEAIAWYDKALSENPKDWNAMRQRGVTLSKQGKEGEAIAWYNKALAENPKDWRSCRNLAVSYVNLGKTSDAWKQIKQALSIVPEEPLVTSVYQYLVGYSDEPGESDESHEVPETYAIEEEPLAILRGVIRKVRERTPDSDRMLNSIKKREEMQNQFFTAKSYLDPNRSVFLCLRKWNSFTPIIPSDADERHVGGGYFLWHGGRGTVVDPGYNFIENFSLAGGRAVDIDNIVITHAHNDHTIDFESILTLVYQYNRRAMKDGERKKQVTIYLNTGTMVKFSGLLNLRGSGYIKNCTCLMLVRSIILDADMENVWMKIKLSPCALCQPTTMKLSQKRIIL